MAIGAGSQATVRSAMASAITADPGRSLVFPVLVALRARKRPMLACQVEVLRMVEARRSEPHGVVAALAVLQADMRNLVAADTLPGRAHIPPLGMAAVALDLFVLPGKREPKGPVIEPG